MKDRRGREMDWRAVLERRLVDAHVVPNDGEGFHLISPSCPCQPRIEYVHPVTALRVYVHAKPS